MSEQLRPGVHRISSDEVPRGWEARQIKDVARTVAGGRLGLTKESHYQSGGIPAFSAAGQDGYVATAEFRDVDAVVLSAVGANCGRCFLALGTWTTLANTQAILPVEGLDARFLYYRTNRDDYWPRSGSAQPFVKPSDVGRCWISLPPLPEQQRIAEILDTLDEAIRKTEQVIAKLQQVKQGLLHDLLTRGIDEHGELRDPDRHPEQFKDSELGRVPRAWEVRPGENLFRLGGGFQPSGLRDDSSGEYLFLKVDDFNHPENEDRLVRSSMTFDQRSRRGIFDPGVIVFPKRGAAILQNRARILGVAGTVDPNLMVMIPTGSGRARFLRDYLLFFNLARICDNSGIPQINNKHIYPLRFPVPLLNEQIAIEQAMDGLAAQTVDAERELGKLRNLKSALMHDLLTGRVRTTP